VARFLRAARFAFFRSSLLNADVFAMNARFREIKNCASKSLQYFSSTEMIPDR
jgi:hypothetical protein